MKDMLPIRVTVQLSPESASTAMCCLDILMLMLVCCLQVCEEPVGAIGLQACKLLLQETDELQHCFTARYPWWHHNPIKGCLESDDS